MPTKLISLAALLALFLAGASTAHAQEGVTPAKQVVYNDGPTNRYLMNGEWLFRLDTANQGLRQGFHKQADRNGWHNGPVSVIFTCVDAQSGVNTCSSPVSRGSTAWRPRSSCAGGLNPGTKGLPQELSAMPQ